MISFELLTQFINPNLLFTIAFIILLLAIINIYLKKWKKFFLFSYYFLQTY